MVDVDRIIDLLGNAILAGVGGFISYVLREEDTNGSWKDHLFACLGASFAGVLAAKLCRIAGVSDDLTFVVVGVAGWIGAANTLSLIERIITDRLGMSRPKEGEKDDK